MPDHLLDFIPVMARARRHRRFRASRTVQGETMQVEYDPRANVAYIRLCGTADPCPHHTVSLDPWLIDGLVNFDIDEQGRIVGLQVAEADRMLPPELLSASQHRLGDTA